MELPIEFYEVLTPILFVAAGLAVVHYLTRNSRNFRSSRNKKARKPF